MPVSPYVLAAINQVRQQQQAQQQPQQAQGDPTLRLLMQILQGADAANTSNFLKKPGTFETDPLLKPFAQAGNPLPMAGAFGAEDKAISQMPSAGRQNTAHIIQALLNLAGILKTNRSAAIGSKP